MADLRHDNGVKYGRVSWRSWKNDNAVANPNRCLAIMLGRLRMNIDDCELEFKALLRKLDATKARRWGLRQLLGGTTLDPQVYEAAIKEVIKNSLHRNPNLLRDSGTAALYSLGCRGNSGERLQFQEHKQRCKV
jgi:hypothetical protein